MFSDSPSYQFECAQKLWALHSILPCQSWYKPTFSALYKNVAQTKQHSILEVYAQSPPNVCIHIYTSSRCKQDKAALVF